MFKFLAGVATALTVMYVKAVVTERIRYQRAMEAARLFAIAYEKTIQDMIAERKATDDQPV